MRTSIVFIVFLAQFAHAQPDADAYGSLPYINGIQLSPSGQLVAVQREEEKGPVVVVFNLDTGEEVAAMGLTRKLGGFGDIFFVGEDNLAVQTYQGTGQGGYFSRSKSELMILNFKSGKAKPLIPPMSLEDAGKLINSRQANLSSSHGVSDVAGSIYLTLREQLNPNISLFEVRVRDHRIRREKFGRQDTRSWFLDADNNALVRLDYRRADGLLRLTSFARGDDEVIFEDTATVRSVRVRGITPDYSKLVLDSQGQGALARGLWELNVESGEISPVPAGDALGNEITRVLVDRNKRVAGFQTSGDKPRTWLYDQDANARFRNIEAMFPRSVVRLGAWSDDFSRLVVWVSGAETPGAYLLFDEKSDRPSMIGVQYPSIGNDAIASTQLIRARMSDDLEIPLFITARNDVLNEGAAPVIVLLDDWYLTADTASFHWLAQYFAGQGYVVIEPRLRGSRGFGDELFKAGDGEFGKGSIRDIRDSIDFITGAGLGKDGEVCLVGFGIGAYAAMAAASAGDIGTRCVAALDGMYDINNYLDVNANAYGPYNSAGREMELLSGLKPGQRERLANISPAQNAEDISAPVFLVHGEQDNRYRVKQARQMAASLERLDRAVEYLEIENYPIWRARNEPRKRVLRELGAFVNKHLPPQ